MSDHKDFLSILQENHQAQIAGFYNDDKTDVEKAKRNAVIEEYQDLISIYKSWKAKQSIKEEQVSVGGLRWVKVESESDLPKIGGYYYCRVGPLKDKYLWTRTEMRERVKQGNLEIEYLPEQ